MTKFAIAATAATILATKTQEEISKMGNKQLGELALANGWATMTKGVVASRQTKKNIGECIKRALKNAPKEEQEEETVEDSSPKTAKELEIEALVAELGEDVLIGNDGQVYSNLTHIRDKADRMRKENARLEQEAHEQLVAQKEERCQAIYALSSTIMGELRAESQVDGHALSFNNMQTWVTHYVGGKDTDHSLEAIEETLRIQAACDVQQYLKGLKTEEAPTPEQVQDKLDGLDEKLLKTLEKRCKRAQETTNLEPQLSELDHYKKNARLALKEWQVSYGFSDEKLAKAIESLLKAKSTTEVDEYMKTCKARLEAANKTEEPTVNEQTETNNAQNDNTQITFQQVLEQMADAGLQKEFLIELAGWIAKYSKRAKGNILAHVNKGAGVKDATVKCVRKHLTAEAIIGLRNAAQRRKANDMEAEARKQAEAQAKTQEEERIKNSKRTSNDTTDNQADKANNKTGEDAGKKEEKTVTDNAEKKEGRMKAIATFLRNLLSSALAAFDGGLGYIGINKEQRALRKWTKKVRKEVKKAIEEGVIVRIGGDKDIIKMLNGLFGDINKIHGKWGQEVKRARGKGVTVHGFEKRVRKCLAEAMVETVDGKQIASLNAFRFEAIVVAAGEDFMRLLKNTKFVGVEGQEPAGFHGSNQPWWPAVFKAALATSKGARKFYTEDMTKVMAKHEAKVSGKGGLWARLKELGNSCFWETKFVKAVREYDFKGEAKKNWKSLTSGVVAGVVGGIMADSVLAGAGVAVAAVATVKLAKRGWNAITNWWTNRKAEKSAAAAAAANSTVNNDNVVDAEFVAA